MTTTTPDMGLVLPDVSVTAGPQWATLLNTAFTVIDSHTHQPGSGVQISPAGLNISSDLTFAQNNATNLRTVRLYPNNTFTPVGADKTCLYALGGELFYIDASGNNVQLTLNGFVDVAGAISALSIKDSSFFIQYFGDTTRQFRFNVSAIPTSTTRILSVPDSGANDSFVTGNATQTLTAKTLTAPVIASINTGSGTTFTLPAADGASGQVIQTNGSATLSFVAAGTVTASIAANDSNVVWVSSDNHFQVCTPTAARTYTMPATLTAGQPWTFYNQASADGRYITLQTSGSNYITIVPPLGTVTIVPLSGTPTAAANWYLQDRQSKWVSYTPIFTAFGTVSTFTAAYRIEGNSMYINCYFVPGVTTAALAHMSIPSGYSFTISGGLVNSTTAQSCSIVGSFNGNGASNNGYVLTAPASGGTADVYFSQAPNLGTSTVPQNGSTITASGKDTSIQIILPIT